MSHARRQRPQALNVNTTEQLFEYLDRFEAKLDRIGHMTEALGRFSEAVATSEYRRDLRQMFNFDQMNARIASIKDVAESVKAAYSGVIAQRDAAVAERDALKADDSADAEKLAAAEANLAATEEMLKTLQAIVAGTPVVLPPDTGGSTAGNTEPA